MIDQIRWKFVISFSLVAMVVSLVSGGLSGVPFGPLMLRMALGGVIFAVLALGLNLIVAQFFSEILSDHQSEPKEVSAATTGSHVDISMPATEPELMVASMEDTHSDSVNQDGTEQGDNETLNEGVSETVSPSASEESGGLEDIEQYSDSFVEVSEEGRSPRESASESVAGENDPQDIARAIHTMMNRDEKG
ncbi:MAG: hypothetical protein MI717_11280 [Spirochaetales bacterium]|nr:hypothetical protein [Spirochaetales bacterium]